jgi:beta-lactamase class A
MDKKALLNLLLIIVVYSFILLFVGRQLTFIPQFSAGAKKVEASDLRQNVLEKFLKGEKGTFSIYYKDLTTGDEFGIDENKVQTGASLNKLPIVAYLYNLASQSKKDLEAKITIQKDDIQDYGTGSIRYDGEGKSYTLKTLAKLAFEQSDNTAAHVLAVQVGRDNVQRYAKTLGLTSTDMENNKTSARDMGRILDLVYQRKVTNEPLTREFMDFLRDTDFEDRLARNLPTVPIYHKAADGVGFVHDVGIVDDGKKKYILAILASDISNEESAKVTIGKISEFVYNEQ